MPEQFDSRKEFPWLICPTSRIKSEIGAALSIERYIQQLDDINRDADDLLSNITDDQVNRQPGEGQWSIGQCFSHLVVSGRVELPHVQHAIRKGRQAGLSGKPPFRYGFLGNWFVRAMDENGPMRFRAPRMYMPPASHFHAADLAADFSYLQQQFKICLEESSGLDLAKIRVTTAVTKHITFSLGQEFALILAHERRHVHQAYRVRSRLVVG